MIINIAGILIIAVLLVFTFTDIDKLISKYLELNISKNIWLLLIIFMMMPLLAVFFKLAFLLNFILAYVCVWAFIYGFSVNRKYIYLLALLFLGATPIFLISGSDAIAEILAIYVYLLLVLGVVRDIFYEKIFKE